MKTDKRIVNETESTQIGRPRRKRVTFKFEAGPKSDVRVAGGFNNWDHSEHPLNRQNGNGTYAATLLLPVGRHEYKFIADGEWLCDPVCEEQVPNGLGTHNSVIEVR